MVPIHARLAKIKGRDAALRRRRPRSADGTDFSSVLTCSVAPLNAAQTAQRAVPTRYCVTVFALLLVFSLVNTRAADNNAVLSSWLNAQKNIHAWSADFTQTRILKSLAQPLTATGHVWFEAPNKVRWELGHPARTIAIIGPEMMQIIYPRLKRVERYPMTGEQQGQWGDIMKLFEAGFPRSQAEMEADYNILGQQITGDVCILTLQPKAAGARKMMPQIKIGFSTKDWSLRLNEMQFADGSIMRNEFKNSVMNPQIDAALFAPKLESDYKIVEPLNK